MRVECQFKSCPCSKHDGRPGQICDICYHGACWHRLDTSQFDSPRSTARRALYYIVPIVTIFLPEVPPLPKDTPRYCTHVKKLPV